MSDDMRRICLRWYGGHIADCERCRLPNDGGWLPCPDYARMPLPKLTAAQLRECEKDQDRASREVLLRQPSSGGPRPSGDICATCGGMNMIRTGTCLTCQDCGDSSVGCS